MVAHMSPEEFRKHGHDVIDWLADYMESVDDYPVLPDVAPGDIRSRLPDAAPEDAEPFELIMRDLDEIVMPGITHWQSPGWFGFFPANSSPPAILGDLISSGLAQQGMLWSTSPACTEIEMAMADWLVDLLGLPETWKTTGPGGGVIQMSASDSTHVALVVAREIARERAAVDTLVAYTSDQAHFSIEKGAKVAGYRHLRLIEVDGVQAMRADALEAAIAQDIAAGLTPAFVASAVGTTGTTGVDPIRDIAVIARRHGLWHHVDAAYAGSAMICEEFRHHQDGLELVDSYTFNPHKWLLTTFDCSLLYVADRKPLLATLSQAAAYMHNPADDTGGVFDYRNWHVPLGRRFRSLKLWFVLRSYGAEALRAFIREHVRLAREMEARLAADDRYEVVAPVPFALVCFRHVDGDAATDALADAINATGDAYVTPSKLHGVSMIRVSIGQTHTEQRHVNRLWDSIDRLGRGPSP